MMREQSGIPPFAPSSRRRWASGLMSSSACERRCTLEVPPVPSPAEFECAFQAPPVRAPAALLGTAMKTQLIGTSALLSTRLAYGCWRICGSWDPKEVTPQSMAEGRKAVIAAYEAGYTLFDNADIYTHGLSEKTFGDALKDVPHMRQRILISTKCGIRFAGEPESDSPQR